MLTSAVYTLRHGSLRGFLKEILSFKGSLGNSPLVQGLGLRAFAAKGLGDWPTQGLPPLQLRLLAEGEPVHREMLAGEGGERCLYASLWQPRLPAPPPPSHT